MRVWTLHIYQVLIATKLVINKSKKYIALFVKHLLLPPNEPLQSQIIEPKPRSRLCKKAHSKDTVIEENNTISEEELAQAIIQIKQMRIPLFLNPMPKRDLSRISGKNHQGFVRSEQEFVKSITETNSKI